MNTTSDKLNGQVDGYLKALSAVQPLAAHDLSQKPGIYRSTSKLLAGVSADGSSRGAVVYVCYRAVYITRVGNTAVVDFCAC